MIDKELLSLVLEENVQKIYTEINDGKYGKSIQFSTGIKGNLGGIYADSHINLDTLGRLCKEWCRDNHYIVVSALINNECGARAKVKYSFIGDAFLDIESEYFYANTESEAIIKATEWVAKEKGLQ